MKEPIILCTALVFLITACSPAPASLEESAYTTEATAIAEVVTTMQAATASVEQLPTETPASVATLTSDYENAAPILMQVAVGIYQLENTDQAVTTAQAQELLSLLTLLKDAIAGGTTTQEQVDALTQQAVAVLTPEQIQTIAAMQVTQEAAMSVMQELGPGMGGPGMGAGNPLSGGMGQPPQGDMPQGTPPAGGPGGQPPTDGQMGMPLAGGMQRGVGSIPPALLDALIEFLQAKTAS